MICNYLYTYDVIQVQQQVLAKRTDLAGHASLGLFEVICGGDLERPIHYSEKVGLLVSLHFMSNFSNIARSD